MPAWNVGNVRADRANALSFPSVDAFVRRAPLAGQPGSVESMLLQSKVDSMGTVFDNPDAFYQLVQGSSAATDALPNTPSGDELRFLNQIAAQSIRYSDVIKKKADVGAFQKDLNKQNLGDRVTVMTFSEFGRRLNRNGTTGTTGTDHGTAAPLVIGKTVRGRVAGHYLYSLQADGARTVKRMVRV